MLAAHTSHPVKLSLPYLLQYIYRPQRSWGKVIFSQACVILFTGGGCMLGCPKGADTPGSRHSPREQKPPPWEQTPLLEQTPPGSRYPLGSRHPPSTEHAGRYASYWNANLFTLSFTLLNFTRCKILGQMSANSHYFLHLSCFHS